MNIRTLFQWLAVVLCVLLTVSLAQAQEQDPIGLTPTPEDAANVAKAPGYSPYAGRNFPTRVYWSDTHIHTSNSLDARGFGVTLGPEEAFRLARGEEVVATHGEPV